MQTAYNDALTTLRAQDMRRFLVRLGFGLATFRIAGDAAGVLHAVAGDVLSKLGYADASALVNTVLNVPREDLSTAIALRWEHLVVQRRTRRNRLIGMQWVQRAVK